MHRDFGLTRYIGFYSVGGKILYAENEIEDLMRESYIPPLK